MARKPRIRNTQAGNPRRGQAYTVKPAAGGTRHVYSGGRSVFVAARPKPKPKPKAKPLTAAQRQAAAANKNPLYNPSVQLAGNNLLRASQQLADLSLRPQLGALDQQSKTVTTQGTALASRAGDYYRQLAAEEAKRVATQQALAGGLNTATADVGTRSGQVYGLLDAAEQQRQQADQAQRGTGLGGDTSQVAMVLGAQRANSQQQQQTAETAAAEQGSNWASLANAMAQTRGLRGGEVQGQLLNRVLNQQADIAGKRADLSATRGDLVTKNLTGLRQQSFENAVTAQGLGLKQADINAQLAGINQRAKQATVKQRQDAAKFKADQAYKRASLLVKAGRDPFTGKPLKKKQSASDALNRWRLNYAKTHGYLPRTGPAPPPKPKDGLTPAQRAKRVADRGKQWSQVQNALAVAHEGAVTRPIQVKNAQGQVVGTRSATSDETAARLRRGGTPEWAVQAMMSIRHHGFVLPSVQSMMRSAGVDPTIIPAQYRRKPARRAPRFKAPAASNFAPGANGQTRPT